jgi:hypothetical protein
MTGPRSTICARTRPASPSSSLAVIGFGRTGSRPRSDTRSPITSVRRPQS